MLMHIDSLLMARKRAANSIFFLKYYIKTHLFSCPETQFDPCKKGNCKIINTTNFTIYKTAYKMLAFSGKSFNYLPS